MADRQAGHSDSKPETLGGHRQGGKPRACDTLGMARQIL